MQNVSSSRRSIVAALTLVALAACSTDSTAPNASASRQLVFSRFGITAAPTHTGQPSDTAPQRLTIADQGAWTSFWSSLAPDPSAGGSAPAVDFSKDMVIAVSSPVRPSTGYSITIEQVTELADRIEVHVVDRSPVAPCPLAMVLTHPYDVVQIPRRDGKPVRFIERSAVNSCGAPTSTPDTARVAFGKSVDTHGVKVTLLAVESDSRCPINALCIWEGDAALRLRFETASTSGDVTLHTSPRTGAVSTVVAGVELQLARVEPFRVIGEQPEPKPSDYVAVLVVR